MKPSSGKKKDEKSPVVISAPDRSPSSKTTSARRKPAFEDLHALISSRAYELYVQRGCRDGHAQEDWLDAEREVLNREFPA
jgi:Protein of unknown function (DUF2934)